VPGALKSISPVGDEDGVYPALFSRQLLELIEGHHHGELASRVRPLLVYPDDLKR